MQVSFLQFVQQDLDDEEMKKVKKSSNYMSQRIKNSDTLQTIVLKSVLSFGLFVISSGFFITLLLLLQYSQNNLGPSIQLSKLGVQARMEFNRQIVLIEQLSTDAPAVFNQSR